jgi:hypothetical protein
VGSPASGLIGNFYVDGNAFLVIAAQVSVDNAIELRNKELGTQWASGIAGRGKPGHRLHPHPGSASLAQAPVGTDLSVFAAQPQGVQRETAHFSPL